MADTLFAVITENPAHTMIFLIAFYMWYCIFDRILIYAELFRRDKNGLRGIAKLTRERLSLHGANADKEMNAIGKLLTRNIPIIKVSVAMAPLLGLLGTVWGMLITFNIISESGTGDAALMSEGISKALTSTRLGLTAAVFGMLMTAVLERMQKKLKTYAGAEKVKRELLS